MQSSYQAETPLGYLKITGLSSVQALTLPTGKPPVLALITVEGQSVRWRDDGSNPTATDGYPLPVGSELSYTAAGFSKLRFLETAASATLHVVFYG